MSKGAGVDKLTVPGTMPTLIADLTCAANGSYTENYIRALCERAATELQSLSQEAVRDEALEEAARVCDIEAASRRYRQDHPLPGDTDMMIQGHKAVTAGTCATAIRALKREPNAEAQASGSSEHTVASANPAPAAPDVLGEQPTHFEMARTRMLRKRIADIVATHDAFVADHTNRERAEALRHAIDKARGIGLTKAEQEKQEDYDCPHAYPHRYCETCRVDPCPLGLGKKSPPTPGASDE